MKNNPYIIVGSIIVVLVLIFGGKALSDKKANKQADLVNSAIDINEVATSTASSTVLSVYVPKSQPKNNTNLDKSTNNEGTIAIGGQRDANGCITGGGYSWDSEIGSCIRAWEKLSVYIPTKKWYFVQNNKVFSKDVFFTIDQNSKISGKVCNSFSGDVKIDNKLNTVTSGSMVSTLMACLDSDVSNFESKFFRIMNGTADVSLNGDNGRITFKKGSDMIEFTSDANFGTN